jgi:glucose-6-phosphate isomerase
VTETSTIFVRRVRQMQEILLSANLPPEQPVYYVLRLTDSRYGPEPNITIIPPARLGAEFPKTYGHFHQHQEPETYRVLYGKALVLLQKMQEGEVEEVRVLRGEVGETLQVPEGYGHCLINATDDLLITADWEAASAGHLYDLIRKNKGMAYYLLEKEGKPMWQPNRHYGQLPRIKDVL